MKAVIMQGGHFLFWSKFQVFQVFQTIFWPISMTFLLGNLIFVSKIPGFPGFPDKFPIFFQVFASAIINQKYSKQSIIQYQNCRINYFLETDDGKRLENKEF